MTDRLLKRIRLVSSYKILYIFISQVTVVIYSFGFLAYDYKKELQYSNIHTVVDGYAVSLDLLCFIWQERKFMNPTRRLY
jgi:hypothetical protein